jgi:aminoglycoside 3-N-acetyltransferase
MQVCPRYYDEVGRGGLTTGQERELSEKLPVFDPMTARSDRDNGTLVEFLKIYLGTRFNEHVARFVFWGKQTEHLMSRQPWDYAFGAGSALDRFLTLDGKIVLLGSDHTAVTFLHYVEHVADIPGKRIARYQVPVTDNGCRVWRAMEEFDTSGDGAHAKGEKQPRSPPTNQVPITNRDKPVSDYFRVADHPSRIELQL